MIGLDNPLHIALVLVVVLMVFGAKRLPEMGKSMGEGLRGFKSAVSGETPAPALPAPAALPTAVSAEVQTTGLDLTPTATTPEPVSA